MIDFRTFLRSKLGSVVLIVSLVMVLVAMTKLLLQKYEVEREISALQEKADTIQKDNDELSELIKYLNTKEYAERAARDKLGLKKEGETVVSIPDRLEEGQAAGQGQASLSNPQKWYNYFFQHD